MQHGHRGARAEHAAADADQRAFGDNQARDQRAAVAQRLQLGVLLHAVLHGHHDGVRDQRQHGGDAAEPQPAREGDQFERIAGGARDEGFFRTRLCRLDVVREFGVDGRGHAFKIVRIIDLDQELSDGANRLRLRRAL